jgi:SNF2 family DNA or RNA helicase
MSWFKICEFKFDRYPINNIYRIISENDGRFKIFYKKHNDNVTDTAYCSDPINTMIMYYYINSKDDPNRLFEIRDNTIFINTDMIDFYINMPIFNALCSYIIKTTYYNNYYFDPSIEKSSFIPNIVIDKKLFNKKLTENFNVKLFDYQKKSIMRMMEIENNINMTFDRNLLINIDNNVYEWDPHNDKVVLDSSITNVITNGGILADTMGLGKTITTIGLMHYGKVWKKEELELDGKIYSKATVVIVPSHLAKQWLDEYIKAHKTTKKVVILLTKIQHDKVTYKEFMEADIIIVTIQFLLNIKNYCMINHTFRSPAYFDYDKRMIDIMKHYEEMIQMESPNFENLTRPLFEYFHFNRVIIDEGHEIMETETMSSRTGYFIHKFIRNIKCKFKWYISGTPFTTFNGLVNIMKFLNLKMIINNNNNYKEIISFDNVRDNQRMSSFIINNHKCNNIYQYLSIDDILERLMPTFIIRHLKEDVKDNINLLGYKEIIEWVELTKSEKSIYDSQKIEETNNRHTVKFNRTKLQQICCHPLIAESFKKIVGNDPVSLENVQEKIIQHHNENIANYTKKIENLDKTNQAYHMLLASYKSKITESKFVLSTLQKINEDIEFKEESNCIICYDIMDLPILTPCGHMFCNNCITTCLNIKPECPICKNHITRDKLVSIKSKPKKEEEIEENNNQIKNPLIQKYGAKLGKLIQMTRSLLSQDARIIIFSQWDEMLLLISKSMLENGIDCSFISGNVYRRNKAISRFKMGGENNSVILLSLEHSASGTNLTEATHIFFVEPIDHKKETINAIEGQAIGRAVRLGQKQVINVIRILCKDTIEEEIYNTNYV